MIRQIKTSNGIRTLKTLFIHVGVLLMSSPSLHAQETMPIGETPEDQQRNAVLLGDYDYGKYPTSLTGYTGQDRQRIASVHWQHAVRTRIGPRGNYKAGLTQLPDGRLLAAVCRDNKKPEPTKRYFDIFVYASKDQGLTWAEVVKTWETVMIPGAAYPRSVIVEPDGNLLMIREGERPNLQLCRSKDGGRTWQFSDGLVDWGGNTWYGEVSAIRLKSGRLLAALRRQIPGTHGEGFEDTFLTESTDGGKHWAQPWPLTSSARRAVRWPSADKAACVLFRSWSTLTCAGNTATTRSHISNGSTTSDSITRTARNPVTSSAGSPTAPNRV